MTFKILHLSFFSLLCISLLVFFISSYFFQCFFFSLNFSHLNLLFSIFLSLIQFLSPYSVITFYLFLNAIFSLPSSPFSISFRLCLSFSPNHSVNLFYYFSFYSPLFCLSLSPFSFLRDPYKTKNKNFHEFPQGIRQLKIFEKL
jgi:hypothetical protein